MNNSSLFTADRMTHLKIVVVALVCATLVAGVGIAARVTDGDHRHQRAPAGDRPGDQGRQAGDRFDRRGQHRPLTSFSFSTRHFARLRARFFLALSSELFVERPADVASRRRYASTGSGGAGGRVGRRERRQAHRDTDQARAARPRAARRHAVGRESPRRDQPADRHQEQRPGARRTPASAATGGSSPGRRRARSAIGGADRRFGRRSRLRRGTSAGVSGAGARRRSSEPPRARRQRGPASAADRLRRSRGPA